MSLSGKAPRTGFATADSPGKRSGPEGNRRGDPVTVVGTSPPGSEASRSTDHAARLSHARPVNRPSTLIPTNRARVVGLSATRSQHDSPHGGTIDRFAVWGKRGDRRIACEMDLMGIPGDHRISRFPGAVPEGQGDQSRRGSALSHAVSASFGASLP
jgi:hypothetical protein